MPALLAGGDKESTGTSLRPQAEGRRRPESLAQLVEHRPFKPRVGGSNPPRLIL